VKDEAYLCVNFNIKKKIDYFKYKSLPILVPAAAVILKA